MFYVLVEGWFSKIEQPQLLRTASQLVGLFVEALTQRDAKPVISRMTPKLVSVLTAVRKEYDVATASGDDDILLDTETKLAFWQAGYYALNSFSKIFTKSPSLVLDVACLPLWQDLSTRGSQVVKTILLDAKPLSLISMQLTTKQLESDLLQEDHAKQVVKNLLFIGKCIMQFHDDSDDNEKGEEEEEEEVQSDNDENEENDKAAKGNLLLVKIFKRLAYIGRADVGTDNLLLKEHLSILWSNDFESDNYGLYLGPAMAVLYRTMNSAGKETDELKNLAKEISEHLQKSVGISCYLEIYNKIDFQVQEAREGRRTKRKVQVIVDPEAAAKRRVQKNVMKKNSKKRKIEELSKKRLKFDNSKRSELG
ncbi:UNVERIFIED_CONTAM: U3 snoRNP protein [Siphonaria sp. JEL0065]|nr:U3 snoRNP protein [Siphonaria sp. JEL0065]